MDTIRDEIAFIKQRNEVFDRLEELAKNQGFLRVESDYFEDFITYTNQNERQDPRKLVKVQDLRGQMFLLQPDITTNIIKQVIPRMEEGLEVEFYYLDNVFSYSESGRIRTTRQFGVEVIGNPSVQADVDIIQLIDRIFATYRVDIVLEIGNQKWIELVLDNLGITQDQKRELRTFIIAKNVGEVQRLLTNTTSPYKELLLMVLYSEQNVEDYIAFITNNELDPMLLTEIERLNVIKQAIGNGHIIIDLSMINPFDYYNGPIFKGYIAAYQTDIVRGGRYDYLTEEYGRQTPALGFSLDVDVLVKEVVRRG